MGRGTSGTGDRPDEQDSLLRALGAPGTSEELAEEDRYRSMFREARDAGAFDAAAGEGVTRFRSRTPRRIAVAAGAAAALAVATGGVAAAYTGSLPDPIQRIAHQVIGAPPTSPRPTPAQTGSTRGPSGSAAPAPTGSPDPSPSRPPSRRPTHHPSRTPSPSVSASASATAGASLSPTGSTAATSPSATASPTTPSPSPTPTPVVAAVTISSGGHAADVGARMVFSGQVTAADQAPLAKQKVVLQQRFGQHWVFVASARADATGSVSLTALPLQRTSFFRLRAGDVRSAVWRVAMHPLLSVTTTTAKKRTSIDVSTTGARPGDLVTLVTRDGTHVDRARLAADGTVTFTVTPQASRTRYAVLLPPSRRHTAARVPVVVPAAKGRS